jgi:hypothetical protein
MPYRFNRAAACCLLICLTAATANAQAPDDRDGATAPHSLFSRLLKNELVDHQSPATTTANTAHTIPTVESPSVTIAIPSYVESSTIRQTSGTSELQPLVTQLPKLDPRLSRSRRQARSTELKFIEPQAGPTTATAATEAPTSQSASVVSPVRQVSATVEMPAATAQPSPAPQATTAQTGYIDEADLSDLEQPLSIKAIDIPPVPKPFYQALAQEEKSREMINAIEDALRAPAQEPAARPAAPVQPTTPPRVEPETDLGPALDSLDFDSLDVTTEPDPPIEDTIQELLDRRRSEPKPPTKPNTRLRLDFPSLLDDGLDSDGDLEDGEADSDNMFDEDSSDDEEEEEYPEPPPIRRPAPRRANYPATLDQVLSSNEETIDPMVEQQFCQDIWACAGGRCLSWCDRMKRDFCRDYALKSKGCASRRHWFGDMICSSMSGCGGCPSGPLLGGGCGVGGMLFGSGGGCGVAGCIGGSICGQSGCTSGGCTETSCTTDSCTASGCGRCNSSQFDAWRLWPKLVGCDDPQFSIGGWTSAGYHNNANGLFNNHPDRLNVHQQWFYAQREARPSNGAWDWGFRVDAMYGVDAADTQAFGNNPGVYDFQNGFDHGIYGWALPQAYGELASQDLSVIFGHFYTLIGYETVTAPDNFFYSHALTFFNSEPFTHTGVLATYSGLAQSELYFGWTLGWDTGFDQLGGGSSFLGGFSTPLGDALNFTYMATAGDLGWRGDGYSHSLLFDWQLSDKWNYVVQSDLLRTARGEDNVGVNQYLFWNINNCLALGGRMEWWKGDNVTGFTPFNATLPATGSFSYYQTTVGANIRPGTTNLVFRPEMRYDWSPGANYEEATFGIDMVLTY